MEKTLAIINRMEQEGVIGQYAIGGAVAANYPDITPILAAKKERRQRLAALTWEEKVAIIEKMRQLLPRNQWRVSAPSPVPTDAPESNAANVKSLHP